MTTTSPGILPDTQLHALAGQGAIRAALPLTEGQIQPASLDLRLGPRAYRIRASFLAGADHTVDDKLADVLMHEMDLTQGAVLETGCVYLVRLMEELALPPEIGGIANPKSSTGR